VFPLVYSRSGDAIKRMRQSDPATGSGPSVPLSLGRTKNAVLNELDPGANQDNHQGIFRVRPWAESATIVF
jgi:hypothetical protein